MTETTEKDIINELKKLQEKAGIKAIDLERLRNASTGYPRNIDKKEIEKLEREIMEIRKIREEIETRVKRAKEEEEKANIERIKAEIVEAPKITEELREELKNISGKLDTIIYNRKKDAINHTDG